LKSLTYLSIILLFKNIISNYINCILRLPFIFTYLSIKKALKISYSKVVSSVVLLILIII
ncbi:hypothetical protein FOC1_g10001162, partial [Fusarium oxysporum f. sp. cubense race 1]